MVYDFPVEFEIKNNTDEPLDLYAYIKSVNQAIIFVRAEPRKKWVWSLPPRRESEILWLDDKVRVSVPEKGHASKFSFHGVYRPRHAIRFYPGKLVLTYELRGRSPSKKIFESGTQRIEIPFAKRKKRKRRIKQSNE
jgi:hypothetical protein